jgi:hypothetical protein
VETAKVLYQNRLIGSVTLSAQSLDADALAIAERKNIPFEYYRQLQEEFRKSGIPTYTELIWGMPGETYQSFLAGVEKVICVGGTPVIYPLLLLNNTEYNEPRIREQHQIRSRMMPYLLSSPIQTEIVIGHAKLSYEEWLKGIALRLALSLFYCGILKFVMTRLHVTHHVSYVEMLERLVEYCTNGKIQSHHLFERVFANYVATWDSIENFDRELIERILLEGERPVQNATFHDDALWKTIIQDIPLADAWVIELVSVLAEAVGNDLSSDFQ